MKYYAVTAVVVVAVGLWFGLRPSKATIDSSKLLFFYGNTFDQQRIYDLKNAADILAQAEFDLNKPTVLYFHGFMETKEVESIQVIANAYLSRKDHNIIILDWGELADGSYLFDALPNAIKLGDFVADVFLDLFSKGLNADTLHVVGHSLGGQLAGIVARKIIEKSNKKHKLKRVTGLDPAFPCWYPAIGVTHLSKTDAELVDVIHTDAWLYGAPISTGTVDFWPNSGKTLQPGCPKRNYKMLSDNDLCSHRRSWRFWAESIANKHEKSFPAIKCKKWNDFKQGNCEQGSMIANMGIDCSPGISGDYYLQTNGEAPFCKAITGTAYEPIK